MRHRAMSTRDDRPRFMAVSPGFRALEEQLEALSAHLPPASRAARPSPGPRQVDSPTSPRTRITSRNNWLLPRPPQQACPAAAPARAFSLPMSSFPADIADLPRKGETFAGKYEIEDVL